MKKITQIFTLLLIITSLVSCENLHNTKLGKHKLKLLHSYNLKIPEPSGLSLSVDKKTLWIVSDRNSKV